MHGIQMLHPIFDTQETTTDTCSILARLPFRMHFTESASPRSYRFSSYKNWLHKTFLMGLLLTVLLPLVSSLSRTPFHSSGTEPVPPEDDGDYVLSRQTYEARAAWRRAGRR